MRAPHELLWYLSEALSLPAARPLHSALRAALEKTECLTYAGPTALLELDVAAYRQDVNALLLRTSELVRAEVRDTKKDYRCADLIGANLSGADLSGANLRGARLIGADLRCATLRLADPTRPDLRDANPSCADITGSLFLIKVNLDAA